MKFLILALIGFIFAEQCPDKTGQSGYTDKWNLPSPYGNKLNGGVIAGALFLGAMAAT